MDIILFCLGVWWLGGLLGLRNRRPKHKRKRSYWKPHWTSMTMKSIPAEMVSRFF